ncbi:MAG: hypothetical protein GTO62_07840 [Planctomycetales bacterium]|nr:hypothetical protein [Planctomycetales bacterium]NIP69167.1 hypothetical protein [Planctomycetales bacterium]
MADELSDKRALSAASLVIGGVLILLGILFLIGQIFDFAFGFNLGRFTWPFFVIIPGVVVFLSAFFLTPDSGKALAIFGSLVTMTGAILFVQNSTGLWASWAYAWALIFPTSVGLGLLLYSLLRGQADTLRTGTNMALIGAGIFLVGLFFFEGIIGVSGFNFGLSGLCWPVLLIGLGVLVLLLNFLPRRNRA